MKLFFDTMDCFFADYMVRDYHRVVIGVCFGCIHFSEEADQVFYYFSVRRKKNERIFFSFYFLLIFDTSG